jgi:hypothetical protein
MPTGYTNQLDNNPTMDTKQWVMEGLARAFGICVTLREENMNLTEEQIKDALRKDFDIDYYKKEIVNAKKLVKELAARTDDEWKKLWEVSETEKVKHNEKSIAERKIIAERHSKVRKDLEAIVAYANSDDTTRNIARFGIQQLDLVKHETEPYIIGPTSFLQFKADIITHAKKNIGYYTEEYEKAEARAKDRIACYERLRKDIDEALPFDAMWNASFASNNRKETEVEK